MASQYYYDSFAPHQQQPGFRRNAPLPPVPSTLDTSSPGLRPKDPSTVAISPLSSSLHDDTPYSSHNDKFGDSSYFPSARANEHRQDPFSDDTAIPLQTQYPKEDSHRFYAPDAYKTLTSQDIESPRPRPKGKRRRFTKSSPWFIYILSLIQVTVFIAEVVKNSVLTGSPIETSPQFNPMIGPSPYVLINMGARYVPCMRNQAGVQNASSPIAWPCPNQTDDTPTCTLPQLCGFGGVPLPRLNGSLDETPAPNQWYRFIIPIFIHAGIIHIGFNMLLQVLLGGDMERMIGPVRLALVYFSSGIFGFVMGGNFAASGITSCGASGSIFGIIALSLLNLFYTWPQRRRPVRDLCWILVDIIISFVLGLLPGLDNFSHIGGFLMGLVLGLCLLHSPTSFRKRIGAEPDTATAPTTNDDNPFNDPSPRAKDRTSRAFLTSPRTFFTARKPAWWAWWLIRAGALVGVIAAFIALVKAFYAHHDTECSWCKYLSCLPIENWCDIGDLTFTQNGGSSSGT